MYNSFKDLQNVHLKQYFYTIICNVMLDIEETLISQDVISCFFACNLSACRGACCIQGDSGAPLRTEQDRCAVGFNGPAADVHRVACGIVELDELVGGSLGTATPELADNHMVRDLGARGKRFEQ